MELGIIEGLISNLGFPIAVSVALFWNNRETIKHYEKLLLEFKTTIDENTKAINSLCKNKD